MYGEIVSSANNLELLINSPITSFAFPFGNIKSINYESFDIAKKRFKYCFSNIRGGLAESPSNGFLFRQNIVPNSPITYIENIILGKLDLKHTTSRFKAMMRYKDS